MMFLATQTDLKAVDDIITLIRAGVMDNGFFIVHQVALESLAFAINTKSQDMENGNG